MQYNPRSDRSQDLVDPDTLHAGQPMPRRNRTPPPVKGPSHFDIRLYNLAPNLFLWLLMAAIVYVTFPLLDALPGVGSDLGYSSAMAAAGGAGLGGALFVRSRSGTGSQTYANTHLFLMISLAMASIDLIPQTLVYALIGPLLVGYGFATFLVILASAANPAKRPETDRAVQG